MTVYRNQGRWDTSNVIFDGRMVTLYDKQRRTRPPEDFAFIDYGLSALDAAGGGRGDPGGRQGRPGELFHALSLRGELAGYESAERFYEIGSPPGLADFSEWLRTRGLIVLDRDGVLNRLLPNPAEPRPDSPMRAERGGGVPLGAGGAAPT